MPILRGLSQSQDLKHHVATCRSNMVKHSQCWSNKPTFSPHRGQSSRPLLQCPGPGASLLLQVLRAPPPAAAQQAWRQRQRCCARCRCVTRQRWMRHWDLHMQHVGEHIGDTAHADEFSCLGFQQPSCGMVATPKMPCTAPLCDQAAFDARPGPAGRKVQRQDSACR